LHTTNPPTPRMMTCHHAKQQQQQQQQGQISQLSSIVYCVTLKNQRFYRDDSTVLVTAIIVYHRKISTIY